MESEHAGRIAFITGGGRGLGKAFGCALAERGAHVVLADIKGQDAAAAAAEITARGGYAYSVTCDVDDEAQVSAAVTEIVGRHGGLDVLINNAGLHSVDYNRSMEQLGVAGIRRLFATNVMGIIICSLVSRD